MKLFDTHSHIYEDRYDEDREEMIASFAANDVHLAMSVGADVVTSKKAIALAQNHDMIYASAGIHPNECIDFKEEDFEEIKLLHTKDKVVAVGEIGLDFHYDTVPRAHQMMVFNRQLVLAKQLDKPVIIHIRDAWGAFLPMLKNWENKGVMHCWTGSVESAKLCLDAGMYISFAGSVTFKNARNLREAAKYIPSDRLVIETDSPYLAPVPKRGKRNEPAYVKYVAQVLADIRNTTLDDIAGTTYENGQKLFSLEG